MEWFYLGIIVGGGAGVLCTLGFVFLIFLVRDPADLALKRYTHVVLGTEYITNLEINEMHKVSRTLQGDVVVEKYKKGDFEVDVRSNANRKV